MVQNIQVNEKLHIEGELNRNVRIIHFVGTREIDFDYGTREIEG